MCMYVHYMYVLIHTAASAADGWRQDTAPHGRPWRKLWLVQLAGGDDRLTVRNGQICLDYMYLVDTSRGLEREKPRSGDGSNSHILPNLVDMSMCLAIDPRTTCRNGYIQLDCRGLWSEVKRSWSSMRGRGRYEVEVTVTGNCYCSKYRDVHVHR